MTFDSKPCSLVLWLSISLWLPCEVWAGPLSVYREIRTIEISTPTETSAVVEPEICTKFKLTAQKIKRLLQTAREIDVRTYAHDLDVSPCTIQGQMTLRNGLKGRWHVQMGGGMRMEFEDQHIVLLHCKHCGIPFSN